jgi:hypothetical protein
MTFKLTIKADTLAELAHKLLAAGVRLNASQDVYAKAAEEIAAAKESDADIDAREEVKVAEDIKAEKKRSKTHEDVGSKAERDGEAKPKAAKVYDYATEVAPLVLELVSKRGRTVAAELLETFDGAKKATEINASRYPELVEALRKALA